MTRYAHACHRILASSALALLTAGAQQAAGAPTVTLTIFAAGTLAAPFRQIDDAFMRAHPEVKIEAQFGGSVKMVKQVTELHRQADVVAVADYSVIPKYFFAGQGGKAYADWYAGFATNAVTFVYTGHSRFADRIGSHNWYELLAQPGVQIGRSNPDTDPSGYQTVQTLELAERYYHRPGLAEKILANAPKTNMRDTETELIAALESGQIDYLAIYRSDARQHKFKYLELPPEIDLSDAKHSGFYAQGVAHTANGELTGKPIVYAVTIPFDAPNREWALKWVQFLLGPDGRKVMAASGFGAPAQALASDVAKVPAELRPMVSAWPKSP
ncbi:MAG TPA: tungstate ABC transporter substrate-binding protein WtpA [Usitatibacter sp.]|nr:tungstate ABC transporter substrate-binding protein WtpA [Usitatibacter sp.]